MCLEAANLTNPFCPELTTDSRKWSPLDISPWFLTSDSNNCYINSVSWCIGFGQIYALQSISCVFYVHPWLSTIVLVNPKRLSGIQADTGPKISENIRWQTPQICPKSILGQTPRSLSPWQMLGKLFCTILGSPLPIIGRSQMARMMQD